MKQFICDRCGAVIENMDNKNLVIIGNNEYELCDNCAACFYKQRNEIVHTLRKFERDFLREVKRNDTTNGAGRE